MSLLDKDFDFDTKDVIEAKCKKYLYNLFEKPLHNQVMKNVEIDWGNIQIECLVKHPGRYGIGVIYDSAEEQTIIRIYRRNSQYHMNWLPLKGVNMKQIIES